MHPMANTACVPLLSRKLEGDEEPNTASLIHHKYALASLVPKDSDRGMVRNFCIHLMARMHINGNEQIHMVDFLWHEIRLASASTRGPFLMPHLFMLLLTLGMSSPSTRTLRRGC